jgi:hypothetical protein
MGTHVEIPVITGVRLAGSATIAIMVNSTCS